MNFAFPIISTLSPFVCIVVSLAAFSYLVYLYVEIKKIRKYRRRITRNRQLLHQLSNQVDQVAKDIHRLHLVVQSRDVLDTINPPYITVGRNDKTPVERPL